MAISLQRLGDNPRDHDGVFKGFANDIGGVSGVRPDAYATLRDATGDNSRPDLCEDEKSFKPWKIYPSPPPPHWHRTDKPQATPDPTNTEGNHFDFSKCDIPVADSWVYKLDSRGVFQVYEVEPQDGEGIAFYHITRNVLINIHYRKRD